jgi:hypothetical protein
VQRRGACRPCRRVVRPAAGERGVDAGQGLAARGDRVGRLLLALLGRREPPDRAVRVAAGALHVEDDPPVLLGDALHERRLIEQVGEVVRAEHDAHDVRVGRLVELHEPRREDPLAVAQVQAQAQDAGALVAQRAAQLVEARLVLGQLRTHLRVAALHDGDVVLQRAQQVTESRDVGRQGPLAGALGVRSLAQLLDVLRAGRRAERGRAGGERGEGEDEDWSAAGHAHGSAGR